MFPGFVLSDKRVEEMTRGWNRERMPRERMKENDKKENQDREGEEREKKSIKSRS